VRILRLDLLAFGPFTDESLDFSGGTHGLHIVYGANEAGKSSSLRALRQWLYGIPHNSSDAFRHANPQLRLGGLLEADDGTRLEFIRRKGRNKTVRGPDDAGVLDESQLPRLLGGVDEQTFTQRFGIDYEELRQGGEAVVCGKGDLGAILFAAGAGITDLRAIQARLEEQSGELFKRGGSLASINRAVSDYADARRSIREAQLATTSWVEHDKALCGARVRQNEIDADLAAKRARCNRLSRVSKSLSLIGRRKQLRDELIAVAGAPRLAETFTADRREAESNFNNALTAERTAQLEIQRLEVELGRVQVPIELLDHRSAITQLHTEQGSHRKATQDRPGLASRLDNARQRAREILQELGRPGPLDQIESLRLPRLQRQRIQELSGECKALVEKQQAARAAVDKVQSEARRLRVEVQQLPVSYSIAELQRTIRRAQNHGDIDEQRRLAESTLQQQRECARVDLAKLPLFTGSLAEVEVLPVPAPETIDRYERTLVDAEQDVRKLEERITELAGTHQELQTSLDTLRLEQDVPSEDDLQHARRRRDAGWELVEQTTQQELPPSDPGVVDYIQEFRPASTLHQAFRASIDAADAIADRLRREAERVARKAKLTADLQQAASKCDAARQRREETEQRRQAVHAEWRSLWASTGIEPLSPREMRSWRTQQQKLAEIAAELRSRQTELDRVAQLIDERRAEISGAMVSVGQPQVLESEPLATAVERGLDAVANIEQDNQRRRDLETRLAELEQQLPSAEEQDCSATDAVERWRQDWAQAVAVLGLAGDALPAQANSMIELVDELFAALKDARELEARIAGIDADAETFRQSVRRLLEQAAGDLLGELDVSVEQAATKLYDRLHRAGTDQTKVDGWREQLEKEQVKLAEAATQREHWEAVLTGHCRQAGCATVTELPHAEEQSRKQSATESELQLVERQLLDQAAGETLVSWIAEAEVLDTDRAQAEMTQLDAEINQLEREKTEASEVVGKCQNELARMDGSGRAADAQLQAEHLLAGIRSDAEQYVRLRLATAVLVRGMERFRENSQGPVLSRAGELFSELTLGSFSGLRADYNDKGDAVLVGIRADDSQALTSNCMSEGTCDQLYLALRLALLETSLEGREPLPFIVDDILVMFDDARAAAALKVLARLSARTQVIFFTHHAHLVEIARQSVESQIVFARHLKAPSRLSAEAIR